MQSRWLSAPIAVIILAFALRLGTLVHGAFIDSESASSITSIHQILNNQIPSFGEKPLLFWISVGPIMVLKPILGFNGTIFFIHGLFLLLSLALVYFFTMKITENTKYSIYAVLLFAIMPTAVLTQGFSNYIGDFYMPIIALFSLFMLILAVENYPQKVKVLIYGIVSITFLIIAYLLWNGGAYAIVTVLGGLVAYLLSSKIGTRKTIILFLIATPILYLLYLHSPLYVGPDLSNVYATYPSNLNVAVLNAIIFFSQQTGVYLEKTVVSINALSLMIIAILSSSLLYLIPTLKTFGKKKASPWLSAIITTFILSAPLALLDSRFESLIILPIAIIAGTGTMEIPSFKGKRKLYILLLAITLIMALFEVIPYASYY